MSNQAEDARGWFALVQQYWPVVAAPGFPVWAFVRWLKANKNATADREAIERKRQDDVNTAQVARLESEITRKDALDAANDATISRLSKDRDRGWDLARWWRGDYADALALYRQYIHDIGGWILVVEAKLAAAGIDIPKRPQPPPQRRLPGLEDPDI